MKALIIMVLVFAFYKSVAFAYEGQRINSTQLNGVWEFALGDGSEGAEAPEGQTQLKWKKVIFFVNFYFFS